MGSGKTTIGECVSNHLKYKFLDLDREIEKSEKMYVSEIFDTKGEIYFRRKERAVFLSLLENNENVIIATGGGTPCYGDIMEVVNHMENVYTIYLKVALPVLTMRLFKEKESRPLIAHLETKELLDDFIRKHLFERSFYYNQSKRVVDTTDLEMQMIVEKIASYL